MKSNLRFGSLPYIDSSLDIAEKEEIVNDVRFLREVSLTEIRIVTNDLLPVEVL